MNNSSAHIVIFVTAKDQQEAKSIADKLLIVKDVQSIFWWDKKLDEAQEVLLIIKTRGDLFSKVEAVVKANHSYDVPEIIALPIIAGNQDYLNWIDDSVN